MAKTLLDHIIDGAKSEKLSHRKPVRWRQRFTDGELPYEHCELATDTFRLAIVRVDLATSEPMTLWGERPPRVASIWPKSSSLPYEIHLNADACSTIGALAKVQDALSYKTKGKSAMHRSATAEFEPAGSDTVVTITAAHASVKATLYGAAMTGGPIGFNLTYLYQALDTVRGSLVRFESAVHPALIVPSETAPSGSTISILMPITPL